MSVIEGERECSLSRPTWCEMTLMDEENRLSYQSAANATRKFSSSDGAAAAADLMDPSGCLSKSTFLAKREC